MANRDQDVGYVYVMLNPVMRNMVKIGPTGKTPQARAKDLYTTGVPSEFVVLWSEFVHDRKTVEKELHSLFKSNRSDRKREFFNVDPQDAIRALMEVAACYRNVAKCVVSCSVCCPVSRRWCR